MDSLRHTDILICFLNEIKEATEVISNGSEFRCVEPENDTLVLKVSTSTLDHAAMHGELSKGDNPQGHLAFALSSSLRGRNSVIIESVA